MKYKVYDIHTHINPGVDDGATNVKMSIEMLRMAYNQGTRSIVCTSHDSSNMQKYFQNFEKLKRQVLKENIDIKLYHGCEIYCNYNNVDHVILSLDARRIPTINETKYVLVEFNPYAYVNEIIYCIRQMHKHGYKTIIAHTERYQCLFINKPWIQFLQNEGCLFQVNAYSFTNESNTKTKNAARKLLSEKRISFIGSDAHRSNHRTYMVADGIDYIYKNCDVQYAKDICYRNAENILNMK